MKYTLYTFHPTRCYLLNHKALKPISTKDFNFLINSLKLRFIPKNKVSTNKVFLMSELELIKIILLGRGGMGIVTACEIIAEVNTIKVIAADINFLALEKNLTIDGNPVINTPILGSLSKTLPDLHLENLKDVVVNKMGETLGNLNYDLIEKGYNMAKLLER